MIRLIKILFAEWQELLEIKTLLQDIKHQLKELKMTIDDIQTKVTDERTVIDSAVTLLNNLSELIRNAANDPAKILQIAADLDSQKQALADAVVANTPQQP